MVSFKLEGEILEVKEKVVGFTSTDIKYWYYNIRTWEKSSTGTKNSKPNRKMLEDDIEWIKKYYLS